MSDTITEIPPFDYLKEDGTKRSRIEMEKWLREKYPRIHWLRIRANKDLGLPKQISWDMKEIVLRHWMLDEMIRREYITGDVLGVNGTQSNDDSEIRQFIQRLAAMIHSGNAVQPQYTEGVDMSNFTPPPPPSMGNVEQAQGSGPTFKPPPAPTGPAYAAPPSVMTSPPGPPAISMPPPEASSGPKRGRRPAQPIAPAVTNAPDPEVPQVTNFVPPVGTQQFVPPPSVAIGHVSPANGVAPEAASADVAEMKSLVASLTKEVSGLTAAIKSLAKDNAILNYKLDVSAVALSVIGRTMTQRPGAADVEAWLGEMGIKIPKAP